MSKLKRFDMTSYIPIHSVDYVIDTRAILCVRVRLRVRVRVRVRETLKLKLKIQFVVCSKINLLCPSSSSSS